MNSFFMAVAAFVIAMVALGLVRVLRGPSDADRLMAVALLGTGGITALLLAATAFDDASSVDVALMLALLAAFAAIAFVKASGGYDTDEGPGS